MKKRSNKIIITMFIVMLSLYAFLIVNIFSASIMGVHLRSKEVINNYSETSTAKTIIKAQRGKIYESTNTVVAEDITSYNILAYLDDSRVSGNGTPHYVVDHQKTADMLAEYLGGESSYYLDLMDTSQNNKTQTEFGSRGKGLDLKTKTLIEESGLPGLEFTTTSKRHYPLGQFSSQLIGFSDLDQESGRQVGKMGIEAKYNDLLTGKDGESVSTVTENGYKLPNTTSNIIDAKEGDDIYLTLNKNIQLQLEESLAQTMEMDNKTDKAWAMVTEISTGKVIAIAQAPSFDPEVRENVEYLFYPTDFVFEPGSTMKAITYAAAIDQGLDVNKTFDSNTYHMKFNENGRPYRVGSGDNPTATVQNALGKTYGNLTYAQGFAVSSNVGMVSMLSQELDSGVLEEYLDKFKFFEPTKLDLLTGSSGTKTYHYPFEKVTTTFGQGSSVTMLQMVQAYGAILNDGIMMQPYVIEQIVNDQNEIVHQGAPEEIGRPISKETSQKMKELMHGVVYDELATGSHYKVDEIEIIAKTGTAQLVIEGRYSTQRYISSVGSAFPADDPKYLVFYAYESNFHGPSYVELAQPVNDLVIKIAEEYNLLDAKNLNQKPAEQDDIIVSEMPNLINHSLDYASNKLENSGAELVIIGEGDNIINQYPSATDKIISSQRVILYTGEGKITMPDMTNWSRKEVVAFWHASGASFIIEGHGNVYNQSVPTGTIIDPNSEVKVQLR